MKKTYDKYKKYDFKNKLSNSISKDVQSTNIFQNIKEYILKIYYFLLYHWKHNRLQFLLVISLLFLFGYYIYINYIKNEENRGNKSEILNEFVKNESSVKKLKKRKIPKKHETRCRIILENLFRTPFITIRPDFLKYPKTGKNLELDMFNENLMLALEYDGVHHRKYTEFFHKSEQDFIDQKDRDHFKEERCKELGITLIRVPDTVKYDDLEEYIKNELDKRGIFYLK